MNAFKKIAIVPYDSSWPKLFEKEKAVICSALGANCVAIHHIGSTSIPGVYSKPKIDIIAVAKNRNLAISDMEKYDCTMPKSKAKKLCRLWRKGNYRLQRMV